MEGGVSDESLKDLEE